MFEVKDIDVIHFGILSRKDIIDMSVCKVDNPKFTGMGSVYDPRMGCKLDTEDKCVTCGLRKECQGHFGYIDLVEPIINPMLYKMASNFLKCFCKSCHRLLFTEEQIDILGFKGKGYKRFQYLLDIFSKTDICGHKDCKQPQPKILYNQKESIISMEYKLKEKDQKESIVLSCEDILKIFDDIQDDDVVLLGLDPQRIHPRDIVLTALPVIPPCSRPYVSSPDGNTCDDDITYQLIEIIKYNNNLSTESLDENKRQKYIQTLKFRISTMFNNSKGKAKHPTDNRAMKSFRDRLVGKGGRMRGHLMGKRVDYSARTVIGAEPTLKVGQLAIPEEVAKIHTKNEVVQEYNIEWLREIVKNGEANFIVKKDKNCRLNLQYAMFKKPIELNYGDIIVKGKGELVKKGDTFIEKIKKGKSASLRFIKVTTRNEVLEDGERIIRNGKVIEPEYQKRKDIELAYGDIVERRLREGDLVLFNRQPTLHKGSMLGMEVVPKKFKSFRFNLSINKSMNADFDGDRHLVANRRRVKRVTS